MRAKRKNMCPNEACERYGEVVSVMGGCDCGTALVPYLTPEERAWRASSPAVRRLVGYMMLADLQEKLR